MSMRRLRSALAGAVLGVMAVPAAAQEFFDAPRAMTIEKACEAYASFRRQAEPETVAPGDVVVARGTNRKTDPSHVFVEIGGRSKWLEIGCGTLGPEDASLADKGKARPGKAASGAPSQCLPFFDESDATVKVGNGVADITPKPPRLDAFDRAINATCGAPGKVVAAGEFKAMMRAHPDVLDRVQAFTGGKVFAGKAAATSREAYLEDLTAAWFAIKAFDHIFCGEPNPGSQGGKIGGLHFHGRYLQLQESGDACRMGNHAQNEVRPGVIYTTGVIMKNASGRFVSDAVKGYGLTLSGEDLIKVVTRAFAENPGEGPESGGCILQVADDGHTFATVFVRRATGIRTFYPDATPNGPRDRRNPPCRAAVTLP